MTSKSGADLSKEDSYGEDEDEYGAEDIIKELLKEGYFNDLANAKNQGNQNEAISEKSQEEEEEDQLSSEDSVIEVNR